MKPKEPPIVPLPEAARQAFSEYPRIKSKANFNERLFARLRLRDSMAGVHGLWPAQSSRSFEMPSGVAGAFAGAVMACLLIAALALGLPRVLPSVSSLNGEMGLPATQMAGRGPASPKAWASLNSEDDQP